MYYMIKRSVLRYILAVVFGFIGAFIARSILPQGVFFIVLGIFSFGILGFILPEFLELAGRAGIAAMAVQISKYWQEVQGPHLSMPALGFKKQKKSSKYINPLICDTSMLIDGRILDVVRTGFLNGTLIVAESVVSELHSLSDSSDSQKRTKGRRGLDTLSDLQKEKKVKVVILPQNTSGEKVDDALVRLARSLKAPLMTLDFNLNKVARIKKVEVLNINELSAALRTLVGAGDRMKVLVREKGSGADQGVGYLPDGTMVVVEGGLSYKGKSVDIEVLRVLQTAAGRMVFAKIANESELKANKSE